MALVGVWAAIIGGLIIAGIVLWWAWPAIAGLLAATGEGVTLAGAEALEAEIEVAATEAEIGGDLATTGEFVGKETAEAEGIIEETAAEEDAAAQTPNASNLPATTEESVAKKLDTYLLEPNHPLGGPKAVWFERALGFTQANQGQLAEQIVFDSTKAVQTAVTQYGTKYNQVIEVLGANGKSVNVLFGWIKNNDGVVRLVTAIPTKL